MARHEAMILTASRLRLLTCAIGILLPAAILIAMALGVAALAPDLPSDVLVSPVVAVGLYLLAFILVVGCITLGATMAARISQRRFTRAEVRSEFLWIMWLPKTSSLSSKLCDKLFPPSGESHLSDKSLERTRGR